MAFSNEIIDAIKDKLPISSIIAKRVNLIKKGNKYSGLCPFHKEKSPSFTVSDDKGFYYCFGCHASGDAFKFLMKTENLNFSEAIEQMASMCGITLPKQTYTNPQQENRINKIYETLAIANGWYQAQLQYTTGSNAGNYLRNRKFDNATINQFQLGFAPDARTSLFKELSAKKISKDLMKEAGLITEGENEVLDKFRNRIIFPIFNSRNQPIAFGGRTISNINPKYLNSPETVLFKKSDVLYAENFAKLNCFKSNSVIVVEGYMDAITLHQHNIKEAVATLGTAMTINHLERLWKLADEPIICFDGDSAGIRAMHRVAELAIPNLVEGKSLNFVILPDNKDPDDLINQNGASYFKELVTEKYIPLSEIMWKIETEKLSSKTPEKISMLEKRLNDLVSSIKNQIIRKNYQNFFKRKLWDFSRTNTKRNKIPIFSIKDPVSLDQVERYEHILIAEIINEPKLLFNNNIKDEFINIDFSVEFLNMIRSLILDNILNYKDESEITRVTIEEILNINNLTKEHIYLCGKDSPFIDKISKNDIYYIIRKWELLFKRYHLSLLEREYELQIQKMLDEEKVEALKKEISHYRELIKKQEILFES